MGVIRLSNTLIHNSPGRAWRWAFEVDIVMISMQQASEMDKWISDNIVGQKSIDWDKGYRWPSDEYYVVFKRKSDYTNFVLRFG